MADKVTQKLAETSGQLSQATDLLSFVKDEKTQKFVAEVQKANQQLQQGLRILSIANQAVSFGQKIANGGNLLTSASSLLSSDSSPSGLQFTLSVPNLPQEQFSVISFELKERYHQPYELAVQFASNNPALNAEVILDNQAYFQIWQNGTVIRTIQGMVADFEQGDSGFHQTFYQLQIVPDLWRLKFRRNSRIFQQKKLAEILTVLLKEHGIIHYAFAFKEEHQTREYCVQWQETDFEFLQRLTAEEGIFYYFEQTQNTHTIVFCDTSEAIGDKITLPYNLNKNAQLQEKCITHFRQRERIRHSSATLKDYTFKKPDWQAQCEYQAKDLENQRNGYEHYDYPGRFKSSEQGSAFSRYRLESLRNDAHLGYGESNSPQLEVGKMLLLQQHPNPKFAKPWQVVAATHRGSQPQAMEQMAEEQGTYLLNEFEVIPYHQTWRPLQRTKPKVDGPQIAMVVGPKGEEIFTDNFGRIRLQFPWDREGQSNDHSSCWIRVTQAWAGQGWGNLAIPRVGQEVLVDFLDGDPDQPIVTGRTYHAQNIPPGSLPSTRSRMVIGSQTYQGKGANSLIFEDANGGQKIDIYAQKDMNVEVLNNQKTSVHQQREICVLAGNQSTDIQQGHLFEKISQTKQTEANAIYQFAKASEAGIGEQFLQADDKIKLEVDGNCILLDKQRLLLKFGGFSLEINGSGIFIDGKLIHLNSGYQAAPDGSPSSAVPALTATQALTVLGAVRPVQKTTATKNATPTPAVPQAEQKAVSAPTKPNADKMPSKEDAVLAAELSDAVYKDRGKSLSDELKKKYPQLAEVGDEELAGLGITPEMLNDEKSGFQANIYKNGDQYFLVYRGTEFDLLHKPLETFKDVKADFDGATGRDNPQFRLARDLANKLQKNLPENTRMSIAGHSLGGELASIGGLATGVPTYSYNAAGLHPNTIKNLDLNIANEKYITAFHTDEDSLTWLQTNRKAMAIAGILAAPLLEPFSWILGHSSTATAIDALVDDDIPVAIGTQIELKTGTGHTISATKEITNAITDYFHR